MVLIRHMQPFVIRMVLHFMSPAKYFTACRSHEVCAWKNTSTQCVLHLAHMNSLQVRHLIPDPPSASSVTLINLMAWDCHLVAEAAAACGGRFQSPGLAQPEAHVSERESLRPQALHLPRAKHRPHARGPAARGRRNAGEDWRAGHTG